MSRIRSLLASRRLLPALVLVVSAAATACGPSALTTGPIACDPMDARNYDWTYEQNPDDDRGSMVPSCPRGVR